MNVEGLKSSVHHAIGMEDKIQIGERETVVLFDFYEARISFHDLDRLYTRLKGTDWSVTLRALVEPDTTGIRLLCTR